MRKIGIVLILTIFLSNVSCSQKIYEKHTENTLKLKEKNKPGEGSLKDLDWYAGRWAGEGFGGWVEENVGPPVGGSMAGSFRMIQEDKPVFYEFILLKEVGNSIEYQVKHFNPDLTGWEEKDDYHTFKLVKLEENVAYFDGMTMKRIKDKMHIYLVVSDETGESEHHLMLSLNK